MKFGTWLLDSVLYHKVVLVVEDIQTDTIQINVLETDRQLELAASLS
jgi:hypothetical protein